MKLYVDKLYRYERKDEPLFTPLSMRPGELTDPDKIAIFQNGTALPVQAKVTARHADGSIRFAFARFQATIPANAGCELELDYSGKKAENFAGNKVDEAGDFITVDTGALKLTVKKNSESAFNRIEVNGRTYEKENFAGPVLRTRDGILYTSVIQDWRIVEEGPVQTILEGKGIHTGGDRTLEFTLRVTLDAGKSWMDVEYRLVNTSLDELELDTIGFAYVASGMENVHLDFAPASSPEGDVQVEGVLKLPEIEKQLTGESIRTFAGISNYRTKFRFAGGGRETGWLVDEDYLMKDANEHMSEVFYGTFMADYTDSVSGICATVYQAQQNYPKAIRASASGIVISLIPTGVGQVKMQSGMARAQRFQLNFHESDETITELDNRSTIYQMPDAVRIDPSHFKESGNFPDIFPEKLSRRFEGYMMQNIDGRARCYGMMNWGDTWDEGYTKQGRGNGRLVWLNNEYDFPHMAALQYVRTGVRRYRDAAFIASQHWMDVDICHYSEDPKYLNGMWEHTAGHCQPKIMACSHEWVEGLLDYYHLSGDERAFEAAHGIAVNVRNLLKLPEYNTPGEATARETGWALRSLTAMYIETGEEEFIEPCERIVDEFEDWQNKYGHWMSTYLDNVLVRVPFMTSVAIGSLMRYYRQFPSERIRKMILTEVDDLLETAYMDCGVFMYKELPSLSRYGTNTLLLEALAIAYELSGDTKYLIPGIETFNVTLHSKLSGPVGTKMIKEDAVVTTGSAKRFAQSFMPLTTFYKAVSDAGLWDDVTEGVH